MLWPAAVDVRRRLVLLAPLFTVPVRTGRDPIGIRLGADRIVRVHFVLTAVVKAHQVARHRVRRYALDDRGTSPVAQDHARAAVKQSHRLIALSAVHRNASFPFNCDIATICDDYTCFCVGIGNGTKVLVACVSNPTAPPGTSPTSLE